MKCSGQIISQGIACGKAIFLTAVDNLTPLTNLNDQVAIFMNAVSLATKQLDKKIQETKASYDERISEIFESHRLIVNDPILIKDTLALIESGLNAKTGYEKAVENVLKTFAKIENEYMLGRIVDIIDATDQVKSYLLGSANIVTSEDEDTIIILKQLKPSIIYSLASLNVKGFLSDHGFYTQHSGIIARKIEIPGMVCPGISERVKENDNIIVDSINGEIMINPEKDVINRYSKEDFR